MCANDNDIDNNIDNDIFVLSRTVRVEIQF
jgi:hypothetical protein